MKYFVILCLTIFSTSVLASSGGGGYSRSAPPAQRTVDQAYETGKNIFAGRNDAYAGVKYCINNAETSEKVKVTRSSLKPHKKSNLQDFASNLYDCNAPEQPLISTMATQDMNMLLYYLNKRYRLKLEN